MKVTIAGLLLVVLSLAGSAVAQPRTAQSLLKLTHEGEITKIEDQSITVKGVTAIGAPKEENKDAKASEPVTFKVGAATKIWVGHVTHSRKTATGQTVNTVQMNPGVLADLEVGQTIGFSLNDDVAKTIVQHLPTVGKAEAEKDATKPETPKKEGE